MSLKSALGLGADRKVRYGIVALGDISQASLMPAANGTGNTAVAALVSGDPEKNRAVGAQYGVPPEHQYAYEQFDALLASGAVDAVYVATPNHRHAEFAVPALAAGVHVLLEKPIEVSSAKAREILDAPRANGAKLMLAYRLRFEPATLAAIDALRSGELGPARSFTSTFAQRVDPANHRAQQGVDAGPLLDMGVYPINAVRNLFEAEPTEAFALATRSADAGLPTDFDHTLAVTLRFPGDRVASFTVSYVGGPADEWTVVAADGSLSMAQAYGFKAKTLTKTVKGKKASQSFKAVDHFGGELRYFNDCILEDRAPEPDGEEGLLDLHVCEAVLKSLAEKRPVALEVRRRSKRVDTARAETQGTPWTKPAEVKARSPGKA